MRLSFRWYGPEDPVSLNYIRQIPQMQGIVSALHDIPAGEVWPRSRLEDLKETVEKAHLELVVIESIPVHESIKLGLPERDKHIEHYCSSVRHMGDAGIPVLCYNFMPVFDWFRTDLNRKNTDNTTSLSFNQQALDAYDLTDGTRSLPGWGAAFSSDELSRLQEAYKAVPEEALWENLAYFLERVVPVAAESNVKMAIHPDDPPWSIFGLPRIITSGAALQRFIDLFDHPCNGITLCSGSLGATLENDVPSIIRTIGNQGRIHFAHCRNVKVEGPGIFHESPHPSATGSVDMVDVMRAYTEIGYDGPLRPDHGRMIWGEAGRPGYGLYDRALGAMYLQGLWEAFNDTSN